MKSNLTLFSFVLIIFLLLSTPIEASAVTKKTSTAPLEVSGWIP